MKSSCKTYDEETLGRFVDNELPLEKNREVAVHLNECRACRNLVKEYTQLSELFEKNTSRAIGSIDTDLLKQNVLKQIKDKELGFFEKVFDYFSPKFYLKIASVLVIIVASLVYFQAQPINSVDIVGPSAIVNSVDGDVSSIMIFETEKTQQTVIWFSEA